MKKAKCRRCGRPSAKRECPALEGHICPACCGSARNSSIQCPAECLHNPFGVNSYDQFLKLDNAVSDKAARYVFGNLNWNEDHLKRELSEYELIEDPQENSEEGFAAAVSLLIHCKLFVEPFQDENCLANRWEREGWKALNNDERVMMTRRRRSYPAILEIQHHQNDTAITIIDLLHDNPEPFTVFDRTLASSHARFSRSLNWVCRYPHYSRIGPAGISLQHDITESFFRELDHRRRKDGDASRREYLRNHFAECCRLVVSLMHERRDRMIENLDMSRWRADYEMKRSREEILGMLSSLPDFERDDEHDGEDGGIVFDWLRRGESKVLEEQMPTALRHPDEARDGTGALAKLTLFDERLVVEAFGKQKFRFAKKMLKKYCGHRIRFLEESKKDLKESLLRRMEEADPEGDDGGNSHDDIPLDTKRTVIRKYHESHYRRFLDDPVPMLENKSPRQAARERGMRPKLIELMKLHIHGIDQRNRREDLGLDMEWVLDELGLEELKSA